MEQIKSNTVLVVLAIIITAIVVGGGVYLWQQQKVIETPQVTPKVEAPISEVSKDKSPTPETSTKIMYKNDTYRFSLELLPTWQGYTVIEEKATEEDPTVTFYFNLNNEPLFAVSAYTKAEFAKINPDENPIVFNTKIAENASFIFTASGSQDNSESLYPRRQEVEKILGTFKAY